MPCQQDPHEYWRLSMVVTRERAKILSFAAVIVLSGIILSGPIAVGLVEAVAPQPPWQDVATFVEHYSWIQALPYLFGFLILGGFVLFMSGLVGTGNEERRPLELAALAFTSASAALIFFNYVLQTAYVPQSLRGDAGILSMLTMANPGSLGWSLEMYGYGILGVATGFAAPLFAPHGKQRAIRHLLAANCVVSVASAALVPIIPGWLLTPPGWVAGGVWNLMIVVLMVYVIKEFKFGRRPVEQRHSEDQR
jgi:hypothetical protein